MDRDPFLKIGFISAMALEGLSACVGSSTPNTPDTTATPTSIILTEGCRPIMATPRPTSVARVIVIDQRPPCDTPTPRPTLTDAELAVMAQYPTATPTTAEPIRPTVTPDENQRATQTVLALTPSPTYIPTPRPTPYS